VEEDKKEDEQDPKQSDYLEFAAALKDFPALTTGFLVCPTASENDGDKKTVMECCFCPCSAQMGPWRAAHLQKLEESVFNTIPKCDNKKLSPKALVEHCESVVNSCNDSESLFLHEVVHKYLEFLFGERGLAHSAFVPVRTTEKTARGIAEDDLQMQINAYVTMMT
jgi:hypothetical protein